MVRVKLIIAVSICAFLAIKLRNIIKPLPAPVLDINEYWGRGSKVGYKDDESIKPFKVAYPDITIERLKIKLNESITLHAPLEGIQHEYGINSNVLSEYINYWKDIYLPKWTERQEFLNTYPQYFTEIQGLKIHFIHSKPKVDKSKTVIPLLFLHGWPGSVREVYEIMPLLIDSKGPIVFEVIAPSLPGFGWSEGSAKVGFGPAQIAVVLRNLMLRLGHDQFLIQGGDFGSIIGSNVAALFPQNVIGYHSNFCNVQTALSTAKLFIASLYPIGFIEEKHQSLVFPVLQKFSFLIEASGYYHIQATKPDTIGAALTGNPIGLAAYILEKFIAAFPNHNKDAVLDNLMIYYLTNSITTTCRLYAESASKRQSALGLQRVQVHVPAGCTRFPLDILQNLDWQLKDKFTNFIHSTWQDKGGHFAAMDEPELLYKDLVAFVNVLLASKK